MFVAFLKRAAHVDLRGKSRYVSSLAWWSVLLVGLLGCSNAERVAPDRSGNAATAPTGQSTAIKPLDTQTPMGVAMRILPGGRFTMGSDQGAEHEAPLHTVTLAPFAMDQYEVTQDQFATLQLPNPAHFKGERRPVEQVRWTDAVLFCNERSRHDGLQPCYDEATFECDFDANGYRLPTEAEWEYAARAGDHGDLGGTIDRRALDRSACYAGTSAQQTAVVGQHEPNAWGFYDLLGNVAEWCHDAYDPGYYAVAPVDNPRGPAAGEKRVIRGGSWKSDPEACHPSVRSADDSGISDACFAKNVYGFRCVRKITAQERDALAAANPELTLSSGTP